MGGNTGGMKTTNLTGIQPQKNLINKNNNKLFNRKNECNVPI